MLPPHPAYRIGAAGCDITPTQPIWLAGYANRVHPSDAIQDPLALNCLSITLGSQTVLLVTIDHVGIEAQVCQELYALLHQATGLDFPAIILSCSHTHFAPALQPILLYTPELGIIAPDPDYVQDFKSKLVATAVAALENQQPVWLETTRIPAPQVAFNRRTLTAAGHVLTSFLYPENSSDFSFAPIDAELTVLRFVNAAGIQAMLVNYSCHPVTGGENHYAVSADYPGYCRAELARFYHCPVFFTLGAAGDVVPLKRYGDLRQRIGNLLANSVILAERAFTWQPEIALTAQHLTIPARTLLEVDPATAKTTFDAATQAFIQVKHQAGILPTDENYQAAEQHYIRQLNTYYRSLLYPDNHFEIRPQIISLGPLQLITLPFEVHAEIALTLKKQNPHARLLSCTGGYEGYLPLAYEFPRGGYEVSPDATHFEIGTGDRCLREISDFGLRISAAGL